MLIKNQHKLLLLLSSLLIVLLFISGCDLLSGDDEDAFSMDALISGVPFNGPVEARITGNELSVLGTTRPRTERNYESVSFRIAEFNGTGSYPIYFTSYSQIIGGDGVASFGFSRDTTGTGSITNFNEENGFVEGEFSFELTANRDFDNVESGESFSVTGRFRSKIIEQD